MNILIEPKIELPKIEIPIIHTNSDELGKEDEIGNNSQLIQTSFIGITSPLVAIEGIVVDNINYLVLDSDGLIPTCKFSFQDRRAIFRDFVELKRIQIQILPPYDGIYEKINLEFDITSISINNHTISGSGEYTLSGLKETKIKAFGQKSTIDYLTQICEELGCGLKTNSKEPDDKEIWRYLDQKNYLDDLKRSSDFCVSNKEVYDIYFDFNNYINLLNITKLSKEEPQGKVLCSMSSLNLIDQNKPTEEDKILTNNPAFQGTELFIVDYSIIKNTNNNRRGSTRKIEIYNETNNDILDYLLVDGEEEENIRYEYIGEYQNNIPLLLNKDIKKTLLNKLNREYIEVELERPFFGINRGDTFKILIYENSYQENVLRSEFEIEKIEPEYDFKSDNNELSINPISGNYFCLGKKIEFKNERWSIKLKMYRTN